MICTITWWLIVTALSRGASPRQCHLVRSSLPPYSIPVWDQSSEHIWRTCVQRRPVRIRSTCSPVLALCSCGVNTVWSIRVLSTVGWRKSSRPQTPVWSIVQDIPYNRRLVQLSFLPFCQRCFNVSIVLSLSITVRDPFIDPLAYRKQEDLCGLRLLPPERLVVIQSDRSKRSSMLPGSFLWSSRVDIFFCVSGNLLRFLWRAK